MQRLPTWRGPPAVVVTAPRAGLGHRPGLDQRKSEALLERFLMTRIDAGAEAEAHAVRRVGLLALELQQDRRHHAEIVDHGRAASPSRCATSAARGNGRAARPCRPSGSCRVTVQPSALMWNSGSGVSTISRVAHRGLAALRHVPVGDAQEIIVREHAAFRLRGRAGGEQQRAGIVAFGGLARHGGAAGRRRVARRDDARADRRQPWRSARASRAARPRGPARPWQADRRDRRRAGPD